MDELVRWLGEQLDEDARIAKAAPRGPWATDGAGSIVDADGGRVIPSVGGAQDGRATRWPEGPVVEAVTMWHPERVLREIDAKRKILRDLEQAEFTLSTAGPGTPPHDLMTGAVNLLRRTVRLHAEVYDERPGYRDEWRP